MFQFAACLPLQVINHLSSNEFIISQSESLKAVFPSTKSCSKLHTHNRNRSCQRTSTLLAADYQSSSSNYYD
jgi:hypothetical protein